MLNMLNSKYILGLLRPFNLKLYIFWERVIRLSLYDSRS